MPTKYAQRFFAEYPDSRDFFYSHRSAAEPYFKLQDFLIQSGYNFSVVGDKLPSHDENFFRQFREFRLVYACRRPESWLAKVNDYYFAQSDLRPALYQYLKGLINAFHHPDRIFVAYETFLAENSRVTTEIANFLGLPKEDRMYEWWSTFQRIEQPVKHAQQWLKGHQSSSKTPESNDTLCHVKSAAFWDPICDLYCRYSASSNIDTDPIDELEHVKGLLGKKPIPLSDVLTYSTDSVSKRQKKKRYLGIKFRWPG